MTASAQRRFSTFQSTLPVAGERSLRRTTRAKSTCAFQSTLPVAGERSITVWQRRPITSAFQSTLPVAGERSCISFRGFPGVVEFQSTLPVAGERSARRFVQGRRRGVSIHAPRCRGAKPCPVTDSMRETLVSIHAPRCRGAKPWFYRYKSPVDEFQSTLPVAGERSVSGPWYRLPDVCFNPRSPLPGSEAMQDEERTVFLFVSIHAPRCRGAKRLPPLVSGS